MTKREPIPYADNIELAPPDEAEDIRLALEALQKILRQGHERSGRAQRDVHVKAHGCATAEFRVLPNLPPELAQGLFAEDRVFSAVVRFSNAAPLPQPDFLPDGRGLAIKLVEVAGDHLQSEASGARTQDFIMVNHPVFFARNVKDFLRFEQVLAAGKEYQFAAMKQAFTENTWNPLSWHWREALTAIQIAGHLPAHPASNTYFSMSPIRFGNYVAKYRARPAGESPAFWTEIITRLGTNPDALRLVLEETLREQHLLFEFQVQLRTSAESMPIEDATVEWPESESPYRTVALLLVPRQEINTPQQQAVCEQLAFNVWHALADHRPLGGINRLRREAYPLSAKARLSPADAPSAG